MCLSSESWLLGLILNAQNTLLNAPYVVWGGGATDTNEAISSSSSVD